MDVIKIGFEAVNWFQMSGRSEHCKEISGYVQCCGFLEWLRSCKIIRYECKGKGKVIPLQARCGSEGGYRYSSTVP